MVHRSEKTLKQGDDESPRFTTYQHVGNAFSMDYPDHWGHEVSDENRSVIFASTSRGDVQLLIMILPYSVDVQLLQGEPEGWMSEFLKQAGATDICSSKIFCYPAVFGITRDKARSWITAHDDLIVAISAVYPDAVEHIYQPLFERMLASFRISRQKQVERQRLLLKVALQLNEACPEAGFVVKGDKLANERMEFAVDNLQATIDRHPEMAREVIDHAVASILEVIRAQDSLGNDSWDEIQGSIYPMIRPDSIVHSLTDRSQHDESEQQQAQRRVVAAPWLADLVVCYAIDQERTFRMIIHSDLQRWGIDLAQLHQQALRNLKATGLPEVSGVAAPDGTLLFGGLGEGGLSSKSSYVLHPDLYKAIYSKLGAGVWVAIPSRDSLMVFSKTFSSRSELLHAVGQDYQSSHHRLSDRLFELTPDGLVLA